MRKHGGAGLKICYQANPGHALVQVCPVNKALKTRIYRILSVEKCGHLMDFQGKECYTQPWPNALKQ
jgi:hypothetical protein